GIPAPVSIFAQTLIKKVNISKLSLKQDLKLLKDFTPYIGILSAAEDNKRTWVEGGQIFEKLWLMATKNKLAVSVWAAAVQDEPSRATLQQILNSGNKPLVIFRLGFAKSHARPSPRFSIKEICF
ncbi:MAG: hypothetical protein ACHQVK_02190, partial [Candidatus Paceibacterales bacterium]